MGFCMFLKRNERRIKKVIQRNKKKKSKENKEENKREEYIMLNKGIRVLNKNRSVIRI